MNEHDTTIPKNQDAAAQTPPPASRKPYTKPAIIYRAPLEAMASVCNPAVGGKSLPCTGPTNLTPGVCYYGFEHS